MRTILIIILALCMLQANAQYTKWVVQFTDKQNSPYNLNNPSAYLSTKAIERRNLHQITIDSTDLPVNPLYIQQVLALGNVSYLSQSKWLNQILISCKDPATIDAINALPFVKRSNAISLFKSADPFIERSKEQIQKLQNTSKHATTTGELFEYGSNYNQVHIHKGEFLHNKGFTGSGITIAILDGGFYQYKSLRAFDSIRAKNLIAGEKDFVDYDNSVNEDHPHGMYCLSTIAANVPGTMVGTAPHASFWLMRTENTASEYPVEEHNWVAAAEFADSAGADMISSSLGYYVFDDAAFNHSYNDFYKKNTTVSMGAAMAAKKGMIVTNSAGNEGAGSWKYIVFPADADSVCAVGAVNNDGVIASFSSYGYPGKVKPNVVSVGAGTVVWGTNDIPVSGNGTSFSNPNINGLIACLWQAFPAFDNMTILNAVYESADRFTTPDNRYGYGIPDMKRAYALLKQKQNIALYGNEWLFATPDPFTNTITVKVIAQAEGTGTLSLLDKDGNTIRSLTLTTEAQEIYDTAFTDLGNLPGGSYTLQYSDGLNTRNVMLLKNGVIMKDWITVTPVPFYNTLTVSLKAPETGRIIIRLVDVPGKILSLNSFDIMKNNYYTLPINNLTRLAGGVYFIQYIGMNKKTIKILK